MTELTMQDRIDRVVQWAHDRNLIDGGTVESQRLKLIEEAGETAAAMLRDNDAGVIDGIGDMAVVCIILDAMTQDDPLVYDHFVDIVNMGRVDFLACIIDWDPDEYRHFRAHPVRMISMFAKLCGFDFATCLDAAWEDIKDRKGRMIDGVFVKEDDLP